MTILIEEHAPATAAGTQDWHDVCWFDDLETGWGEAAWIDGRQVALFRFADGSVHAADQRCPATGSQVMARGIMGGRSTDAGLVHTIASPLHKETYRLDTGECLTSPGLSLPVHRVRVEDGRLWVGFGL
ncbi:nitrite reductase small subunit NirD [Arthrobacter sp. KK5.5]|uniref:nitrite reductase small subunit NirD n=1 Tax=Arthrobacter sp. KK5.5 TaxID=3373084 RepID=UPI003EE65DAF